MVRQARTVALLIANQEKQALAVRRDDTPAANRYMKKVNQARNALAAKGNEGQATLEELMQHPMPQVRLDGAVSVMQWAPHLAIPVLGNLIVESKGEGMSVSERVEIAHEATLSLFDYFGTRLYDRDELIEPLKAYGIDLPRRK